MIHCDLADIGGTDAISAAVAHIDDKGLLSTDQHCHQRCTHALEFFELCALIEYCEVTQLHRALQDLVHTDHIQTGMIIALDLLRKYIASQITGDVTGFGATHSVADHT